MLFKQNENTQGNNYYWKQARESEKQKTGDCWLLLLLLVRKKKRRIAAGAQKTEKENDKVGVLVFTGYKGTKMP